MPVGPFATFADCVIAQKKKGNSDLSARKICGTIEKMGKKKKELKFHNSDIFIKEEGKTFCSEGFAATTHPDRAGDESLGIVGDILSEKAIDKIVYVLNNPKESGHPESTQVSYRHDWVKENDTNLAPAGINIFAEKRQTDDGHWGAWVKTEHSETFPDKDKLIYEVEKRIIPGYSIEYNSTKDKIIDFNGDNYRFIDDLDFYSYGFANGRAIANPQADITATGYKEMLQSFKNNIKNKSKETNKMKDEKQEKETKVEDSKVDIKDEISNAVKEAFKTKEDESETSEEVTDDTKDEVKNEKTEEKTEDKESKEKIQKEAKEATVKEMIKTSIKEAMEKNKPLINTKEKMEIKEIQDYKESILDKETRVSTGQQWKEAAKLHNFLSSNKGVKSIYEASYSDGLPFECKEKGIELKDLQTDTNVAGAQSAFVSILSNYEQYPTELNAIYQPVILNQLNDEISTWNLLPKDDFSTASAINFRVRDARNSTAGGYTEANARTFIQLSDLSGNVGRTKYNLHFAYYRVLVSVTGPAIALANSVGGIGDVFSDEVRNSTLDLMRVNNLAVIGTGDGTAEDAALGFEKLILGSTGTLYGRDVSSFTLLQGAGRDDMSSAPITIKKMREMIRAAVQNGARVQDLAFIGNHLQIDFMKGLIQDMQRLTPTSANVGFTENITLDGVTLFPDHLVNTDDLFLVDITKTRIGIKVAPTLEMFGKIADAVSGQIKIYWNLYSTHPNHNYWIFGLATS